MGDLSKNFSRWEFACHCGCGQEEVSPLLVEALQRLRDAVGKPIHVTSGCRCPAHNQAVKGSPRSQHCIGRAADIQVKGMSSQKLGALAETIPGFARGGVGLYDRWVHVDVRVYGPVRWDFRRSA